MDDEALDAELGHVANERTRRAKLQRSTDEHLHELQNHYRQQREAYIQRIQSNDVRIAMEASVSNALRDVRLFRETEENALHAVRRELTNHEQDYAHFKSKNNLVREPHYPENRFRHITILIFVGLLETILNGSLLATGLVGGLIQGWSLALVIALINIGGAFCIGNLGRLVNDRSAVRRALGFISLGLGVTILTLFNALVAHYRSAMTSAVEAMEAGTADQLGGVGVKAWETFSTGYFDIPDFMSWLLFSVGMLSAGLAAWKGYALEDPYPGFSRRARTVNMLRETFQQEHEDAIENLSSLWSKATEEVDYFVKDHQLHLQRVDTLLGKLRHLPGEFDQQVDRFRGILRFLHHKHCPEEDEILIPDVTLERDVPTIEQVPIHKIADHARNEKQRLDDDLRPVFAGLSNSDKLTVN